MQYNGKNLEITDKNSKLKIKGKDVDVTFDGNSGTFSCPLFPYEKFENLENLGKIIIDKNIELEEIEK